VVVVVDHTALAAAAEEEVVEVVEAALVAEEAAVVEAVVAAAAAVVEEALEVEVAAVEEALEEEEALLALHQVQPCASTVLVSSNAYIMIMLLTFQSSARRTARTAAFTLLGVGLASLAAIGFVGVKGVSKAGALVSKKSSKRASNLDLDGYTRHDDGNFKSGKFSGKDASRKVRYGWLYGMLGAMGIGGAAYGLSRKRSNNSDTDGSEYSAYEETEMVDVEKGTKKNRLGLGLGAAAAAAAGTAGAAGLLRNKAKETDDDSMNYAAFSAGTEDEEEVEYPEPKLKQVAVKEQAVPTERLGWWARMRGRCGQKGVKAAVVPAVVVGGAAAATATAAAASSRQRQKSSRNEATVMTILSGETNAKDTRDKIRLHCDGKTAIYQESDLQRLDAPQKSTAYAVEVQGREGRTSNDKWMLGAGAAAGAAGAAAAFAGSQRGRGRSKTRGYVAMGDEHHHDDGNINYASKSSAGSDGIVRTRSKSMDSGLRYKSYVPDSDMERETWMYEYREDRLQGREKRYYNYGGRSHSRGRQKVRMTEHNGKKGHWKEYYVDGHRKMRWVEGPVYLHQVARARSLSRGRSRRKVGDTIKTPQFWA